MSKESPRMEALGDFVQSDPGIEVEGSLVETT